MHKVINRQNIAFKVFSKKVINSISKTDLIATFKRSSILDNHNPLKISSFTQVVVLIQATDEYGCFHKNAGIVVFICGWFL